MGNAGERTPVVAYEMFAKQTIASASLATVLVGATASAYADPERQATGTFEVGAGYSNYESLIASARVAQSSLFGTGHMLALDARISARRQDLALAYETADLGGGLTLQADLFARHHALPGFERHGSGVALALQQRFGPNLRAFVGYRYEQLTAPVVARLSTVRAGMVYETPGEQIGMVYELADRQFGSDYTFDRLHAWAALHRPVGPFTVHLGGSFTRLMGDVPQFERLFIDGVSDLRGYSPGALAPLGGLGKAVGRAELELPLVRRIGLSLVGFVDGAAMLGATGTGIGSSAGVGLVWKSPIGTLRLDWAVPLDGDRTPRFVFSLGLPW